MILVRKHKKRAHLSERVSESLEYSNRMELNKTGWQLLNSFNSGQGPLASSCECSNDPVGSMKCGQLWIH
jgi:hypothetical protein